MLGGVLGAGALAGGGHGRVEHPLAEDAHELGAIGRGRVDVLGGVELVEGLGRRTRAKADACAAVALVWVPAMIGQYSLIVDGQASPGAGDGLVIRPTRAVLHRPAPGPVEGSACGADCREIALPGAAGH